MRLRSGMGRSYREVGRTSRNNSSVCSRAVASALASSVCVRIKTSFQSIRRNGALAVRLATKNRRDEGGCQGGSLLILCPGCAQRLSHAGDLLVQTSSRTPED